jgi:hypothetical protein
MAIQGSTWDISSSIDAHLITLGSAQNREPGSIATVCSVAQAYVQACPFRLNSNSQANLACRDQWFWNLLVLS